MRASAAVGTFSSHRVNQVASAYTIIIIAGSIAPDPGASHRCIWIKRIALPVGAPVLIMHAGKPTQLTDLVTVKKSKVIAVARLRNSRPHQAVEEILTGIETQAGNLPVNGYNRAMGTEITLLVPGSRSLVRKSCAYDSMRAFRKASIRRTHARTGLPNKSYLVIESSPSVGVILSEKWFFRFPRDRVAVGQKLLKGHASAKLISHLNLDCRLQWVTTCPEISVEQRNSLMVPEHARNIIIITNVIPIGDRVLGCKM
ncbi:hypothetical protein ZHAS_00019003 [Anopheles sinensis]|uniref:Uncharacterized protein n=1 Tax=Anopheles sinensis TaxID=74873 RepID=A0A084WL67_ANOSI|nr:hypothetical protein ZHAS_00019003 [Anopheles sinensis]